MSSEDLAHEKIEEAIETLSEFVDSVQIFATLEKDDGRTLGLAQGRGDYYARRGVVSEWLESRNANIFAYESGGDGDE